MPPIISASEATAIWRLTNMCIIIIIALQAGLIDHLMNKLSNLNVEIYR